MPYLTLSNWRALTQFLFFTRWYWNTVTSFIFLLLIYAHWPFRFLLYKLYSLIITGVPWIPPGIFSLNTERWNKCSNNCSSVQGNTTVTESRWPGVLRGSSTAQRIAHVLLNRCSRESAPALSYGLGTISSSVSVQRCRSPRAALQPGSASPGRLYSLLTARRGSAATPREAQFSGTGGTPRHRPSGPARPITASARRPAAFWEL